MRDSKNDLVEEAVCRSDVYGLLARIYRKEADATLIQQIKSDQFQQAISELGISFYDDFHAESDDELVEKLGTEFTRLFIGPGKHISPHESVHRATKSGESGMLWSASTVEVQKLMKSAGFELSKKSKLIPDHISVELEFMQVLIDSEADLLREDDMEGALYSLDIQKRFLKEHLAEWIPAFCEKVISLAELSFYRTVTSLTKEFIDFDSKNIEKYINEANNGLPPVRL